MSETLVEMGTPWAETYRGSGRFTSILSDEPVYMNTGDVAPGWLWVGEMTEAEFYSACAEGEHDYFHINPERHWDCEFCNPMEENNGS